MSDSGFPVSLPPIAALREEVEQASRRWFPLLSADEVQTALDALDAAEKVCEAAED